MVRATAVRIAREIRAWCRRVRWFATGTPAPGSVDFGDLRRTSPFCADFGFSRGQAVDRIYIEQFLSDRSSDIRGNVLEILDDSYTRRFGSADVLRRDVLDIDPANKNATLIADLTSAPHVAEEQFDTIIITQTLQLIFDVPAALSTLHRLLRPGGVLLVTVPGISSIGSRRECHRSWCWSFTDTALRRLLTAHFAEHEIATHTYGNVLAATGFLQGLAAEEFSREELSVVDSDYPVIVAARAVKIGQRS
jgi:SAM-dependent methyltransferase